MNYVIVGKGVAQADITRGKFASATDSIDLRL